MTEQAPIERVDDVLEAEGASCATLTPIIRARIRMLESGDVLEVRTDDPSAHGDISAWSRMTGNELLAAIEEDAGHTRFYLRKK